MRRDQIVAEIWLESGLPADLCETVPELKQYGKYRKLKSGQYEVLSYCEQGQTEDGQSYPLVQNYVSMLGDKFYQFLDALLPKKKR